MIVSDITISFLFLIGIRMTGFLMFLSLFLHHPARKYLVLMLAWFVYMLGPFPALFGDRLSSGDTGLIYLISATVATVVLSARIYMSYKEVSVRYFTLAAAGLCIVITALLFIFSGARNIISLASQLIFVGLLLYLLLYKKVYPTERGVSTSLFWLVVTLTLSIVHIVGFLTVFSGLPHSIRFFGIFLINISLLEYFISFDWEQSMRKLKESDERYRFIFNTAPVALIEEDTDKLFSLVNGFSSAEDDEIGGFIKSDEGSITAISSGMKILDANNKALRLFGVDTRIDLQRNLHHFFSDDSTTALIGSVSRKEQNHYTTHETKIRTLAGTERDVLVSCYYPEKNDLNKTSIVSMIDITERNEVRREIEKSLKEKEVLLQEVHHRVKNNLAIITSIIGLQSEQIEDDLTRDLFKRMQNRISTMALVHEQLYSCSNIEQIDAGEYLKQLCEELQMTTPVPGGFVQMILEIDAAELSIDHLIPIGLLVNEIVTNSLRHAFDETSEPKIDLQFRSHGDEGFSLLIRDNGRGGSERSAGDAENSTGMIIIDALVYQLHATMDVSYDRGYEYRIFIPCDESMQDGCL